MVGGLPMDRVHTLDTQPGPLPEIRASANGVIFVMTPQGTGRSEKLVIRCNAHDEVLISIQPKGQSV
jgi:hypothetical protein